MTAGIKVKKNFGELDPPKGRMNVDLLEIFHTCRGVMLTLLSLAPTQKQIKIEEKAKQIWVSVGRMRCHPKITLRPSPFQTDPERPYSRDS